MTAKDFRFHVHLDAFEKAGDENPMRIGGIASTDRLDKDQERILQEGLDFSPFLEGGWFNDNHGQRTTDVLGYPEDAKFVRKGDRLPNGRTADKTGWWVEGYLLNTEAGRQTWAIAQALKKSPRRLGFSIEGKVQARMPGAPNVVARAIVKNVAITHCPVNIDTELHPLAKALTAGSAISNPGATPGEGFALRAESLDRGTAHRDPDVDDVDVHRLSDDPADDPNVGGWAGLDPHATAMKSPSISKAEAEVDADFTVTDDYALIDSWAPHVAKMSKASQRDGLTKSEARRIVRAQLPHLSTEQVDAIVANATRRQP